ncbi:MAG: alpha/beta fold hydrolase, partial [Oleibacter sp.]|nr:alpha/beta fold hydrolase [Thalassolituus sp.]
TWSFVRHYLTEWDEILVPDFPGMGASNWHNSIQEFDVDALVESCVALIEYFGWKQFDIVGYSMGGLVAMHFVALNPIVCTKLYLIEPAALLSDKPSILVERGETYLKLSQRILAHANDPESYVDFLNHVSPLRKKNSKTDTVALERLQQNSQGLAMGLQCVGLALIKYADWYANWTAPVPGLSIVGGLSHQSMHNRHQLLCDGSAEWFYHSLSNADHSLVYSKPRQVAGLLNTAFNKPF